MSLLQTRKTRAVTLLPLALAACAVLPAGAAVAATSSGPQEYSAKYQQLRVKPRIVGGTPIQIGQAPWQVYLRQMAPGAASYEACGGSIIDSTTIVTAGHCVFDATTNLPAPGANFQVFAGVSRYNTATGNGFPGEGQQRAVLTATPHPFYVNPPGGSGPADSFADDVSVLKLATPLTFNANVQPVPLPAENNLVPFGSAANVTGYGLQNETPPAVDGNLYSIPESIQDPTPIGAANAVFTVGATPAGSFCSGDSGGGLTSPTALIGVVSATATCQNGQPNFYTNVTAGEIQEFIKGNLTPPRAARGGTDVLLTAPDATPSKGDVLKCSAGTWDQSPTFSYTFTDARNGAVLQSGPSDSYTVTGTTDAGATISCRASASNAGGVGLTPPTRATPAVAAAPVPPAPKPKPKAHYRLSASLTSSRSSVRRGQTITYTITSRNRGNRQLKNVRQCIKLSSRYTLASRNHGKVSGGSICWTNSSLRTGHKVSHSVKVRIDRDAKLGRLKTTARSTSSTHGAHASAARTVTIRAAVRRHRKPSPQPPFVTG